MKPSSGLSSESSGSSSWKHPQGNSQVQILTAKRADAGADTSAWEAEIDRHVYALYGLTPAEIQIVEATATPAK